MWIKIRSEGGPNFSIPVPLFFLGMPFIWRMIARNNSENSGNSNEIIAARMGQVGPKAISELKGYIRRNGHFTLLDVESSDGYTVRITV